MYLGFFERKYPILRAPNTPNGKQKQLHPFGNIGHITQQESLYYRTKKGLLQSNKAFISPRFATPCRQTKTRQAARHITLYTFPEKDKTPKNTTRKEKTPPHHTPFHFFFVTLQTGTHLPVKTDGSAIIFVGTSKRMLFIRHSEVWSQKNIAS